MKDIYINIAIYFPYITSFLVSLGGHYDVPDKCKAILQMIVFELDDTGRCVGAKKIKIHDDKPKIVTQAWED